MKARATISLYERTVAPSVLHRQGCRGGRRGAGGIVILDFGKPSWNGNTYGTILFSGAFASNEAITTGLLSYAQGYAGCLTPGSPERISLARGTSNYHPRVPSTYKAGLAWAAEAMRLSHLLDAHGLSKHVISATADDVEPAWDPTFKRTRDFYRGYADARTGQLLYNYGSLDGGIKHGIWHAKQAFYVASGMRYSRALPEIYTHDMAREWAALAQIARNRYHQPLRFAGIMTEHTSSNHGTKPDAAHQMLVRELSSYVGAGAVEDLPTTLTNINKAG